ncbi:hypothetical protein QBC36DRAFT_301057 [Triangularia setosa]|uniref:Uncharacterized protein n=1 Tax=Triangularia setosa TaxID=2587417 RepID=A0AAN6W7C5_9PEZI|nr:hypothetical protein QBC36DRAFT_301057 [Podospora setosa]
MGSSPSINVAHFLTITLTLPTGITLPPLTLTNPDTTSSNYGGDNGVCDPNTPTSSVTSTIQKNTISAADNTASTYYGIETITPIDAPTPTTSVTLMTSTEMSMSSSVPTSPPNFPPVASLLPGAAPAPTESHVSSAPAPNAVLCAKQEGQLECLDGRLLQGLCSHEWVIPQPVAMGMICDSATGKIALAPRAVKWKREDEGGKNMRWGVRYGGVVPA